LVRTGVRSISVGIAALSIWFALKSTGTQGIGPANVRLQAVFPGISVFGTIHPKLLDFRMPLGSQIPDGQGVRMASPDTGIASESTVEENEALSEPPEVTPPCASFDERFFFSQHFASFDERFVGAAVSHGRAPAKIAEAEEEPDSTGTITRPGEVFAPSTPFPFPGVERRLGTREDPKDSNALADSDAHTAIYDIAAHVVYLPDGHSLEAHSGLGARIDDPRFVNLKGRGPTPPNIYQLTLREHLFHGVRALRLVPVGDGDMYGRDGILAHSYMLGHSGQSNGCVAFSNYPAFLKAYLNGEVSRLVVVQHLPAAPGPRTASGWRLRAFKDLFRRS
jgi:hypothetical protein